MIRRPRHPDDRVVICPRCGCKQGGLACSVYCGRGTAVIALVAGVALLVLLLVGGGS